MSALTKRHYDARQSISNKLAYKAGCDRIFSFFNLCSGHPRRKGFDIGSLDIVYTFLRGDGSHPFFYVETRDPMVPQDLFLADMGHVEFICGGKGVECHGELGAFKFFSYLISTHRLSPKKDILISNAERAFKTPLIRDTLVTLGVSHFELTPPLHH